MEENEECKVKRKKEVKASEEIKSAGKLNITNHLPLQDTGREND